MKFLKRLILSAGMAAILAQPIVGLADTGTNAPPDFKEVYDLIKAHLTEGDADLNHDAVMGLLGQLHGKVSLVTNKTSATASTGDKLTVKSVTFEGPIGYVRAGSVSAGLANEITSAYMTLSATNALKGLVVDLRFVGGDDYAEAASVADLFVTKERPLLDWGKGVIQSKEKTNALMLPVVVLVNSKTSAAAEALAAVMREDDRAILIGASTAGEASMSQDFPLKNGEFLRIATSAIKIGDGESLSIKGVSPDIRVNVKLDDEQSYLSDPYKEILSPSALLLASTNDASSTNRSTVRPHQINEADLMRARKEKPGVDIDNLSAASLEGRDRSGDVEKPVVRDPVLGRALDLIKGISVIRHPHSS